MTSDPEPDLTITLNGKFVSWMSDGELADYWGKIERFALRRKDTTSPKTASWINSGIGAVNHWKRNPIEIRIELMEESNFPSDIRLAISEKDAKKIADTIYEILRTTTM